MKMLAMVLCKREVRKKKSPEISAETKFWGFEELEEKNKGRLENKPGSENIS